MYGTLVIKFVFYGSSETKLTLFRNMSKWKQSNNRSRFWVNYDLSGFPEWPWNIFLYFIRFQTL